MNDYERIIDKSYILAKNEFDSNEFTTSQLWKLISKKEKLENNADDSYINFYVDLLQDPRFVAIGNDKWKLREFVTISEFNKLSNSKYSNVEYNDSVNKDDEKIIEELIDEDIDEEERETHDNISNNSEEYEDEQELDDEIEEEDIDEEELNDEEEEDE